MQPYQSPLLKGDTGGSRRGILTTNLYPLTTDLFLLPAHL